MASARQSTVQHYGIGDLRSGAQCLEPALDIGYMFLYEIEIHSQAMEMAYLYCELVREGRHLEEKFAVSAGMLEDLRQRFTE